MKELRFQQQEQFPLTINVRILKLWNPAVCSVHSGRLSYCDTISNRRGRLWIYQQQWNVEEMGNSYLGGVSQVGTGIDIQIRKGWEMGKNGMEIAYSP